MVSLFLSNFFAFAGVRCANLLTHATISLSVSTVSPVCREAFPAPVFLALCLFGPVFIHTSDFCHEVLDRGTVDELRFVRILLPIRSTSSCLESSTEALLASCSSTVQVAHVTCAWTARLNKTSRPREAPFEFHLAFHAFEQAPATSRNFAVSKGFHSVVSTLINPSRDASTRNRRWVAWPNHHTSRLLDEARPGPRGADGVLAYRHDRRVAPAVLLRFVHQRRSLHRESLDASWNRPSRDSFKARA